MSKPSLTTFGEAMIRFSPPMGERTSRTDSFNVSIGGAELNVAISAKAMGIDSTWISSLPDDEHGARILRHCREFEVKPSIIPSRARVGLYFAELGPAPRGSTVHYDRAGSAFAELSKTEVNFSHHVGSPAALFSSGISMAVGKDSPELVEDFLDSSPGALRCFEVNYRSKLWDRESAAAAIKRVLGKVDVLFASPQDLTDLLHLGKSVHEATQHLMDELGVKLISVPSRTGNIGEVGTNSAITYSSGSKCESSADGFVLDPIGAGDAGTGAFLGEYLVTGDVALATEASVHASAFKQTHYGDAAQFSRNELSEAGIYRVKR